MRVKKVLANIIIEKKVWKNCNFNIKETIEFIAAKTLQSLFLCELNRRYELSIKLTDDLELQKLNKEFMGKDKPTNVL